MSKKSSGFLVGAVIGGAAAAAAALLLAPKSGKELREDLIDQLDEVSDGKATELASLAKLKTEEYSWVGDKVATQVDQAKAVSSDLFENFVDRTSDIQDEFQRTSGEVKGRIDSFIEEDIVLKEDEIAEDLYASLDNEEE